MLSWEYKWIRLFASEDENPDVGISYSISLDGVTYLEHEAWSYINKIGEDGWELVAVIQERDGNCMMWFKREYDND